MTDEITNEYEPAVVSPPGVSLLELLKTTGMSQVDLAQRTGRPEKTISEIINGKASITPETALQLEHVLGVPSSFWNNRQRIYDEWLAKQKEHVELKRHVGLLKSFPVNEMKRVGWLNSSKDKITQLKILIDFFSVASSRALENLKEDKYQPAYRKSCKFEADEYALLAWLRRGEIQAKGIECHPFNKEKFDNELISIGQELLKHGFSSIYKQLVERCSLCGVALVFVPALKKTHVNGASRWLKGPEKSIIQISFRYRSADIMWFTFFHEAHHVLHGNKTDINLNSFQKRTNECEQEDRAIEEIRADNYASKMLIPNHKWNEYVRRHPLGGYTKHGIMDFAEKLDVTPGIVVGRLQKERKIGWKNKFNNLKEFIDETMLLKSQQ